MSRSGMHLPNHNGIIFMHISQTFLSPHRRSTNMWIIYYLFSTAWSPTEQIKSNILSGFQLSLIWSLGKWQIHIDASVMVSEFSMTMLCQLININFFILTKVFDFYNYYLKNYINNNIWLNNIYNFFNISKLISNKKSPVAKMIKLFFWNNKLF